MNPSLPAPGTQLRPKHSRCFRVAVLCALGCLAACRSTTTAPDAPPPVRLKSVLVLPFKNMAAVYGPNLSVRCPLCGNVFTTGKVENGASNLLTEHLVAKLKAREGLEVITSEEARGDLSTLLAGGGRELSEHDRALEAGRRMQTEGVIAGYVYRFSDRVGAKYSVESPASVTFDFDLIQVSDGRLLWSGAFDETQKPLFEDLFQLGTFLRRGGAWLTAAQLAQLGLDDILATLDFL